MRVRDTLVGIGVAIASASLKGLSIKHAPHRISHIGYDIRAMRVLASQYWDAVTILSKEKRF